MNDSKNIKFKNYKNIFFLAMLYIIIFLKNYINSYIIALFSIVLFMIIYNENKKIIGANSSIIILLIYSIPISFLNIKGGSYGELPISWFNIFAMYIIFIGFITMLKEQKIYNIKLTMLGIYLIFFGIILIIISNDYVDAIKQYINIALFIGITISANILKYKVNSKIVYYIEQSYINTVILASLFLFLQIILHKIFGISCGFIDYMGTSRIAYGFLFNDYSFFSLYLASGISIVLDKNKKNKLDILKLFILTIGCILTSARTGIVALIVAGIIKAILGIVKLYKRSFKKLFIIISVALISFMLIFQLRGEQTFNDSGRLDGYIEALPFFKENKLTGIGLGVRSYKQFTGLAIPHNFIIQFLVQTGIIYTLLIVLFMYFILKNSLNKNSHFSLAMMTVLVGSLFIPDILSSRFLSVLGLAIEIQRIEELQIK